MAASRSPAKSATPVGAVAALIVSAFLVVSCSNDEREAQAKQEAAIRVAEKQRADDAAAKAAAESKAQAARDAEAALKSRLADVDSVAQARIAKHQERLACMGLYFACSPSDDGSATHGCEKPTDYDLTAKIPDDDPVRKVPSWTTAKCDKLLPDFERQNKQALDKAAREEKIKAAKAEHDEKRYANHCGGDYASEGVRVVDQGVEYELIAYTRSGGYVSARVRLRNTGDSPADGLSLGYSQAVTTGGKEFDLDGGGCTPDALNPGQTIACTLTFAIPKEQEVEGIKVSTLSKWHFAGSLCAKDFVP